MYFHKCNLWTFGRHGAPSLWGPRAAAFLCRVVSPPLCGCAHVRMKNLHNVIKACYFDIVPPTRGDRICEGNVKTNAKVLSLFGYLWLKLVLGRGYP